MSDNDHVKPKNFATDGITGRNSSKRNYAKELLYVRCFAKWYFWNPKEEKNTNQKWYDDMAGTGLRSALLFFFFCFPVRITVVPKIRLCCILWLFHGMKILKFSLVEK